VLGTTILVAVVFTVPNDVLPIIVLEILVATVSVPLRFA
jgi:hypothetical protein